MCTPRKNNSLYETVASLPPPTNPLIGRRAFFEGGPLSRSNNGIAQAVSRENNEATCKGDPYVPPSPYTETVFTEGGVSFNLVTGNEFSSSLGLYEIKHIQLITDGVITFFWVYISATADVPPFGVSYGLPYLNESGVEEFGYAIKTDL